ncbi:MAG: peptidoglycan recognition family protein [Planctomycetota bacterium]
MPEKRTILVLSSLVVCMAVTAGALRIMEPGAVPPIGGVTLLSIERNATERPEDKLFAVSEAPRDWRAIVIHDSRTLTGSYDAIDKAHRRAGKAGCGYHLVVNNGTGDEDGRIEVGYRWKFQESGDYLLGPNAGWYHQKAIGICIVGDADQQPFTDAQIRELTWLVRQLQQRFDIPAEYVFTDLGSDPQTAGKYFSPGAFRAGLIGGASLSSTRP